MMLTRSLSISSTLFRTAAPILQRQLSTTASDELQITRLTGDKQGITELGLYRPAGKNSFNKSLLRALQIAIHDIKQDNDVRVVLLRSLVPGVFSAGADLKERLKLTEREVVQFVTDLRSTFTDLSNIPPPVICAIDGAALGGGLELALACDLRVATKSAKLGLVETKLAIMPGAGGTQRLPRLINPTKAKEMIFTAQVIDGQEAEDLGLVNYAVDANENNDAAYQKALAIAEKILPNGPLGVRCAKRAINQGLQVDIRSGLSIEESIYGQIIPTKDRIEGLLAFREKRVPNYKGE